MNKEGILAEIAIDVINREIADFLDYHHSWDAHIEQWGKPEDIQHEVGTNTIHCDNWIFELAIHLDWNELMAAIDKINKTHSVSLIDDECEISTSGYEARSIVRVKGNGNLREAVYMAIYKFIQLKKSGVFIESRK